MAKKGIQKSDVVYIAANLVSVKLQIDKIHQYINCHDWTVSELDVIEKSFKFHADINDRYLLLLERYASLCGILDFYKQSKTSTVKEVRKGSKDSSGVMDLLTNMER